LESAPQVVSHELAQSSSLLAPSIVDVSPLPQVHVHVQVSFGSPHAWSTAVASSRTRIFSLDIGSDDGMLAKKPSREIHGHAAGPLIASRAAARGSRRR
jgi:hypothetical protein